MRIEYLNLLKAMIWMLDGAKYLWQDNKENAPTKE